MVSALVLDGEKLRKGSLDFSEYWEEHDGAATKPPGGRDSSQRAARHGGRAGLKGIFGSEAERKSSATQHQARSHS